MSQILGGVSEMYITTIKLMIFEVVRAGIYRGFTNSSAISLLTASEKVLNLKSGEDLVFRTCI